MNRITTLSFALITAAALAGVGCQKRDENLPAGAPGAGPGTTTTMPGGTTDSTSPAMPPASAASQ